MNRLYRKPKTNPAFKLRQPLPVLPLILQGNRHDRADFAGAGAGKKTAAINEPLRGGLISLCKNFAFSNLF
jgi:hypothetical protein